MKRLLMLSAVIWLMALATCLGLDRYGKGSRRIGPARTVGQDRMQPLLVASPEDAYRLWKARGYHGRILLYLADGWDRLDPNEFNEPVLHLSYPFRVYRIPDRIEARFLAPNTFLYVAALQGIARRVVAVVSPESFALATGLAERAKDARIGTGTVYLPHQGFPRCFTTLAGLPPADEPVLLYVAASAFRAARPGEVLAALRHRGVRTDAAVLCAMAGDGRVSEGERRDLGEFARLLAQGGG